MSELDTSLGFIVIGTFINVWLHGILINQVTSYYISYKHDRMWVKVIVALLLFLDTLTCVFGLGYVYRYTITLFGNPDALTRSHWSMQLEPTLTVTIGAIAQGYFALQINRLTGWSWVSWSIGVVLVVQFLAGLATTIGAAILVDFAKFGELKLSICLWLVSSVVADIATTSVLTWYLHSHRTGFPRTDDIITRLIRATVQTGLTSTLWAVVNLSLFLFVPNEMYMLFNLPLSKLYSITLLSTLNARSGWEKRLKGSKKAPQEIPVPMVTLSQHRSSRSMSGSIPPNGAEEKGVCENRE